jgi:glycosyltransferase involved in cell wall biosynthesis
MEISSPKATLESSVPTKPIRIAFVITELEPGGAERCLVELATRLDRNLFSPAVYSLGPEPPLAKQVLVQSLITAAVPTHFLGLRRPWHYFRGVRHLAALLREQQPDIVQTFLFHANVVGARAAALADVPHHVAGLRVADPRHWRTTMERWASRRADRLICVSQSVADFYRQRGFPPEKLQVIPNGIDVAQWQNQPAADLQALGVPSGRRVFVFVGRLDQQKGLDRLFPQLPWIFEQLPQHDFLLIGEGPLSAPLQSLANRLGIAPRVHFAGWRSPIAPILAAADLLVLPSRWEGMPNVILEAMACGKPLISTRVAGVLELLGESGTTQSEDIYDYESFARRTVELLHNPKLRRDLGVMNGVRASQAFSITKMLDEYQQLYYSLARCCA